MGRLRVNALLSTAKIYFSVTKPRIWWLLVYTTIVGMFAAADGLPDPKRFVLGSLAFTLGTAGAEAVSNYIERDIDSIMTRTMRRPIPAGKIKPAYKALALGVALLAGALALALAINPYVFILLALGAFDYLIVYVVLAKRRTPLNIILGSFAGGAPLLGGYAVIHGGLNLEAAMLAALVMAWIPSHVWSLALKYRDDYERAGIPMLPVILNEKKAARVIASTAILLVVFSFVFYAFNKGYGVIYLSAASIMGGMVIYLSLKVVLRPSGENAWRLFKFTSPYLALLFTAVILDALV